MCVRNSSKVTHLHSKTRQRRRNGSILLMGYRAIIHIFPALILYSTQMPVLCLAGWSCDGDDDLIQNELGQQKYCLTTFYFKYFIIENSRQNEHCIYVLLTIYTKKFPIISPPVYDLLRSIKIALSATQQPKRKLNKPHIQFSNTT